MATQKLRYSRTDAEQTYAWETGAEDYPNLLAEPDFTEEAADICCVCGEPLGWHEQACTPSATIPDEPAAIVPKVSAFQADGFIFALGSLVLLDPQAPPAPVVWRGQLKERHPVTGLVQRVPVYRLDDGYWDCYREEELQVA